jgi:hypothetical protein
VGAVVAGVTGSEWVIMTCPVIASSELAASQVWTPYKLCPAGVRVVWR